MTGQTGSEPTSPTKPSRDQQRSGRRSAQARRPPIGRDPSRLDPIAPDWVVRIVQPTKAPVPWRDMARVTVSIVVPLAVGVLIQQQALAIFAGMGALVGAFGDRGGTFLPRFSRISAGVLAGLIGLLVGQITGGQGVVAVIAVGALAVVSALMSAISATLSFAGLQLLVYVAIAGGVGGKASVAVVVPAFLVGALWSLLMSFVQSRFDHAEDDPRKQVAGLLRQIADLLRAPADSAEDRAAQRAAISLSQQRAVDTIVTTRSHSPGRRSDLRELNAVLSAGNRLMTVAYGYSRRGERASDLAALVDQLATAVQQRDLRWRPPDSGTDSDATTTRGSVLAAVRRIAAAQADPRDAQLQPVAREAHRMQRYTNLLFGRSAGIFAVRLAATMMVAEIVRQLVPTQKPYWILLTAALVLKPDLGSVFARGLQRTLGTMIGVLIGAIILQVVPAGGWLLIPMAVFAFGFPFAMSRNYGLLATFITPLVFLLLDFGEPVRSSLILARLADTALGALIVLVVGYLFWPSTWRPRLGPQVADATDALTRFVKVAFGADRPATGAARRHTYRTLSDVRSTLQSTLAEPPPMSTQAAAWWPLIAQLERAADSLTHAVLIARTLGEVPAAHDIDQIAAGLEDLAGGLRGNRPPKNLPLPDGGPLDDVAVELAGARRMASRGRGARNAADQAGAAATVSG